MRLEISNGFAWFMLVLLFQVASVIKLADSAPSVQFHDRTFLPCAPRRYSHLAQSLRLNFFLDIRATKKFPSSLPKPESQSHHLYAGCRLSRQQASLNLVPEYSVLLVLTAPLLFTTRLQQF